MVRRPELEQLISCSLLVVVICGDVCAGRFLGFSLEENMHLYDELSSLGDL